MSHEISQHISASESRIVDAFTALLKQLQSSLTTISKQDKTRVGEQLSNPELNVWLQWREQHSLDIASLSDVVSRNLEGPTTETICNRSLASLHFTQIQDRKLQIRKAHVETFRWIFQTHQTARGTHENFAEWLATTETDRHLFWVAGKPGSGKSTLMRLISDEVRGAKVLKRWCGKDLPLIASTFFWISGSLIQRSLNGMHRTILFDLFNQNKSVVPDAVQWRWRALLLGASDIPDWTNTELLEALRSLVQAVQTPRKIFPLYRRPR